MTLFASPHTAGLRVVAIDPGASLGWAYKRADGLCKHGVHKWPSQPKGRKWRALNGLLTRVMRDIGGPIDAVYIEKSTWKRHPLAMLDHGGFLAIVELFCDEIDIVGGPVGVAPTTIKKHICGRSRGVGKEPVMDAINALGFAVTSHDEADALALLDLALAEIAHDAMLRRAG